MDEDKRKELKQKGRQTGDAAAFLALTPRESVELEKRLHAAEPAPKRSTLEQAIGLLARPDQPPPTDAEVEQILAEEREARFGVIDEIRARHADADPEQVERDVAEAIRAVRQSKR